MAMNGVIICNVNKTETFENIHSYPSELYYDTSDSSNSLTYTDLTYHTVNHHMDMEPSCSSAVPVDSNIPFLSIEDHEKMKDQIRFRYLSESGCHGGVKPTIKLHNYTGDVRDVFIKVSLYMMDEKNPHVFELDGKQCAKGVGWQKLSPKECTAKFSALSICMKKKDEISSILKERKKSKLQSEKKKINEQAIEKEVREEMKNINLSSGKLCFEAFLQKEIPICEKIFSKPIFNQKCSAVGDLKITRLSSFSGSAAGGEDVILLCEKVKKDDIEIIFFEDDSDGQVLWESKADFNPNDVHYQVAIPFKTPAYKENTEKKVKIKLLRKSDGRSGEPREFIYKFDEELNHSTKRRKPNPSEELIDQPLLNILDEDFDFSVSNIFQGLETHPWEFDLCSLEDSVTPEADIDLDSLSLSPANNKLKKLKKNIIEAYTSNSDKIQTLKEGIISILKNRDKKSFLNILPVLLSIKDENANTLLHLTIEEKSEELNLIFRLCEVAHYNQINQANKSMMTPLHLAVSKNLSRIVKVLLEFGADPNRKDKKGNNSLHLAAKYGYHICLIEILKPLLCKTEKKFVPNIDELNYEGYAPLHLSVMANSKFCTEALIQAKADINIADRTSGKRPLHIAYENNSSLVEFLLSKPKIDKNAEDFRGCTPNSSSSNLNFKQKALVKTEKPSEICIDMSIQSSGANTNNRKEGIIEEYINEEIEKKICQMLDSNDDLWKKFGLYVMDEKELKVIAKMDSTPTKTILNELKKQHGKNYTRKLKFILSDSELKHVAANLQICS